MDADIVAYQACSAHQEEFLDETNEIVALTIDLKAAYKTAQNYLSKIVKKTGIDGEFIICLSDVSKDYFRKDILPDYKKNRTSYKTVIGLKAIKAKLAENYRSFERPRLEADDVMGILATWKKFEPEATKVIVSEDKDLITVGAPIFNPASDKQIWTPSQQEADRFFYYQVLTGDTVDNYAGCPSVGPKTANTILDKAEEESVPYWEAVVAAYEKKGLTEDDALVQARCARILRADDYDFKKKETRLWTPEK